MRIHSIETFTREPLGIVRVRSADGAEDGPDGSLQRGHHQLRAGTSMPHALERDGDDPEDFSTPASMASEFLGSYLARALAGVDTALWDLRGKREGKSVCELAGGSRGRCGSTAPTSAAADSRRTSRTLVRERDAHGYSAFKVKIGRRRGRDMDEWPGRTRAVIQAVREALGDAVELLADANAGYGPEQAIEVGRLLERHGFTQFEEPCPHQELEWTRGSPRRWISK